MQQSPCGSEDAKRKNDDNDAVKERQFGAEEVQAHFNVLLLPLPKIVFIIGSGGVRGCFVSTVRKVQRRQFAVKSLFRTWRKGD